MTKVNTRGDIGFPSYAPCDDVMTKGLHLSAILPQTP